MIIGKKEGEIHEKDNDNYSCGFYFKWMPWK